MLFIKFLALIFISFLVTTTTNGAGYDGYKLYEIIPATREHCDLLFELSKYEDLYDFVMLSKIPKQPARVIVNENEHDNFLAYLKEHQMEDFKLLNENIGKSLEFDFNRQRLYRNLQQRFTGKGRLSTERYYTHDEINNYIEDLAKRYPKRVYVKTVGYSYYGRHLKTIAITNGDGRPNKKVILMDGGFHAREWISPAAVLYVIEQLVENYAENADLLKEHEWVILPVVNADGYEYTQTSSAARMWRKTRQPYKFFGLKVCKGADPNRNFDFHWNEEGASSTPCSDIFAGPKAFSEPETIVVRDLIHSLSGRGVMYLTLHSYGNYLLYPWGWTEDLPETWQDLDEVANAGGDAIREATGTVYTVGSSTNVLYIAAGASDDYAFYAGFPISITMELPGGGEDGFNPPPESIDSMVKETWIGIRAMAKKVAEKY